MKDLERGNFSFSRFYERRARRILPPLLVVLLACLPVVWLRFPPWDLLRFSKSLFASVFFSSNILFAMQTGYFNAAGWRDPLLHTWSLAAEEQFYLLFPFLFVLAWRRIRPSLTMAVGAVLLVSLASAELMNRSWPIPAFYLLPTRLWELMAGSLLTLTEPPAGPPETSGRQDLLTLAGLAMIALAVFRFNAATPWPGLYTLHECRHLPAPLGEIPGFGRRSRFDGTNEASAKLRRSARTQSSGCDYYKKRVCLAGSSLNPVRTPTGIRVGSGNRPPCMMGRQAASAASRVGALRPR